MSIKAVAFDFGNVISLPQEEGTIGRLAAIAGIDEEAMSEVVWARRADYDRGDLSGEEYYRRGLAAKGVDVPDPVVAALVRADLESWANVNPATVALMEELRGAGYKIGILSNMPHDFLALARKRFPFFTKVDAGIYSCELSVNKPDKAIYDALASAFGEAPADIVFFDDVRANVEGAAAAGVRAFLWTGADAARADLAGLGVLAAAEKA